ncbi:MAG: M3 family metallopeptidase, partial [Clostridiales bacterium]|nr:M3 family metallopeptidase [Clostridiales bacterium]
PGAERTWMRQPHYYTGLYSYTYSAGLTVSTAAGKRIQREGQQAAKDWIKMLKLGGTMKPEALAKEAGVDITTDAALKETIAWIGQLVDEI